LLLRANNQTRERATMFKRNGHDAVAIANEMLRLAEASGKRLTIMQLLKLVYFAHGWSMAVLERELISDDVQAWKYGPVIPAVYNAFVHTRGAPITAPGRHLMSQALPQATLSPDEVALVTDVYEGYGHLHAFQLSDLTHQAGTPWSRVFHEQGAYSVIPDPMIKEYFVGLQAEAEKEPA
jgi:uncharacterized phage-associated protein